MTDAAATTVFSLQKTEMQLVDDDSNGVVDDEQYGPAGATGDFRMGVPTATSLGINLNQSVWAPGTGFLSGSADVDLAVGAADTAAPSAPASAVGMSGDKVATVSWAGATDDNAVAGYYVARWLAAPAGAAYSPVHTRVATLAPSARTYSDTGLTNGSTYYYEIRAFDASGNVGPRSATAVAAPMTATTVYRFYNKKNGSHFYTASPAEKASVEANLSAIYRYEGVAYKVNNANPVNSQPLYRFYNKKNGSHFYTANAAEKAQRGGQPVGDLPVRGHRLQGQHLTDAGLHHGVPLLQQEERLAFLRTPTLPRRTTSPRRSQASTRSKVPAST